MEVQQKDEGKRIMEMWKHRVFCVMGKRLNDSGVLVNNKRILTAAHLGFTLNEVYNIFGTNNRQFSVKCCYISNKLDFAVLQSDDLADISFRRNNFSLGRQYFILGYPHFSDRSSPAIMNGLVEILHSNSIHYIGISGARAGYSGGPVINKSDGLSGILLGGIHEMTTESTIQEVMNGFVEQKYVRLLPLGVMEAVYITDLLIKIIAKIKWKFSAGSDNDS